MKCLIITNPTSGTAKNQSQLETIKQLLSVKFEVVDTLFTEQGDGAEEISKQNCGKYDVFIVLGGDGTLNETIRGIAGKDDRPTLGYIPSGTMNDFAVCNGISFDYKKAVDIILQGHTEKRGCMFLNGIPAASYLVTGMFHSASFVTESARKRKWGKLAYFFDVAFRDPGRRGAHLTVELDGEKIDESWYSVLIAQKCTSIGSLKVFSKGYKIPQDDGFWAILARRKKGVLGWLASLLRMVRILFKKVDKFQSKPGSMLIIKIAKEMKIINHAKTTWNIDGEKGPDTDVHITFKPDQFEILLPATIDVEVDVITTANIDADDSPTPEFDTPSTHDVIDVVDVEVVDAVGVDVADVEIVDAVGVDKKSNRIS